MLGVVEALRRRHGYAMIRTGPRLHRAIVDRLPTEADVEILPGIRMVVDLSQPVELLMWWAGARYESPTPDILDRWAASASHFFDCGANAGFFALRAVVAGCPNVHAFEPNPVLHRRLADTAARNRLDALHAHQLGLSDRADRLELSVPTTEEGHASFGPRDWDDADVFEVDVVAFDDWCRHAGIDLPERPSWVAKIDVEGFELRVVEGMAEALAAKAFAGVVVELNELTLQSCGTSIEEVVARLGALGYVEGLPRSGPPDLGNGFFVPVGSSA